MKNWCFYFVCTLYDYGIYRLKIRPFGLLFGVCQAVLHLDSLSLACLTNHNTERRPNDLTLTERLWQYHPKWKQPKWKFSTFCGLPGTTSYPYLQLRMIDPPDTRSHPQGGVQIYPQPNHLSKKGEKKYIPPNSDFS